MGPIAITLILALAFTAFAVLAWRKLSIVVALCPDVRWDHPGARFLRVVRNGLLQQRMVRGDPRAGVMHAVIFAGFLSLLARKLQLVVIGYDATFTYSGVLGAAFALGKDVVDVAVLAAVAYAFWRRLVVRPMRLEPNREVLVILSLIGTIMLTDLSFDAFRFALFAAVDPGIAHEMRFAPIGMLLANAVSHWGGRALSIGYSASYWLQMVTVFCFLVLLPLGEHFHVVTALPALFFANPGPLNRVPAVDLDAVMNASDETTMKVGARTAADLTWKEALDAFTCTECGRCTVACAAAQSGKPLALKWVNDALKHHLLEQRDTLIGHGEDGPPPLVGTVVSEEALWACTTCGYCEAACPIELEHLGKFYRLRQHQVMMEGAFPHELKAVFDAYEVQSNPWGLAADTRGDWARDVDVPIVTTADEVEELDYLFYVGSAESFDARGQKIARAFVRLMQAAGVRIGILGAAETSTGECVRRAGNEMLFQRLAQALVQTLNGLHVERIVTCDPHAYNTLRNEYPKFGGHYEVVHHTHLIAELVASGRLKLAPSHQRVIYHEPCYLSRHNGQYDAPRRIIAVMSKDTPIEFDLARERAMCCGAGGARMWMEENTGRRMNVARVEQALAKSPATIATACPYCAVMMTDGAAALDRQEVVTRDIAELALEALAHHRAESVAH